MKAIKLYYNLPFLLAVVLLILILTSCENKIQVKIDEGKKSVCIDAFLNDLSPKQAIRVTNSDGYFSGKLPPAINGANVVVKDLTSNTVFNFSEEGNGNYSFITDSLNPIAITGHQYQLNVKIGSVEYESITTCRRTTAIDSTFYEFKEAQSGVGSSQTKAGYRLRLIAADSVGTDPDFYWIKIFKNGKFYSSIENQQIYQFGFNNEFDGELFPQDVWVTQTSDSDNDPLQIGDVARIEIHGISKAAFDFMAIGFTMANNGGLFATTPVNLPTNIRVNTKNSPKPLGAFNVARVSVKNIVIQ
jgi:hypothetical protein